MSAHKTLFKPTSHTINKKKNETKDAGDNRRKHQRKLAHIRHSLQKVELKDFNRVATLGIGGFARVELVTFEKGAKIKSFAMKKIRKHILTGSKDKQRIKSESSILSLANDPFVVSLYATMEDSTSIYFLTEACLGGELWTLLRDMEYFNDSTARFYAGCVLEALDYLHGINIVYRDVKPENLLLGSNGYLKLVDFGLAKQMQDCQRTYSFCGTAEYISPEVILEEGHSYSTDFWSLGILIAEMVTGNPPFAGPTTQETYEAIIGGIDKISFPQHVTIRARNIIKKLCRAKPKQRLGGNGKGVKQIRKDIWFESFDWQGLSNLTLRPPMFPTVASALDTSNFDNFIPETDLTDQEFSAFDGENVGLENTGVVEKKDNVDNCEVEETDVGVDVVLMADQISLSQESNWEKEFLKELQSLEVQKLKVVTPSAKTTNSTHTNDVGAIQNVVKSVCSFCRIQWIYYEKRKKL